ncbi:hypothetical protein [Collinsella sp. An307]|uniref:hypothetical protein n=1 Tax=Collinsella sp. An307 TaxID=1965630 RepID=UPI000B38ED84|nr:hypothetical protein [Collinsella sp. An307]OUO19227.1 hypothetical protein B5F89_08225 [Collinsella sp. An307]
MLRYIKEHWLIYLIGVAVAVALGLSASYVVGVIGSTPVDVRAERRESEQQRENELSSVDEGLNDFSGEVVDEAGEVAAD